MHLLLLAMGILILFYPLHALASGNYGPDTCLEGYVWREATGPNDHVCVTPDSRRASQVDNALQDREHRHNPDGTCKKLFVYRLATPTDHACVSRDRATAVSAENLAGPDHRASLNIWGSAWTECSSSPSVNSCFLYIQVDGDHFNFGLNNIELFVRYNDAGKITTLWNETASGVTIASHTAGAFSVEPYFLVPKASAARNNYTAWFRARDLISTRWSKKIVFTYRN